VVAIMMMSALVACLLPAEHAANADPVVALRMG
jgi:ABC-type lipoprotein release transport system permease subunit